jgi:hypothetical protein
MEAKKMRVALLIGAMGAGLIVMAGQNPPQSYEKKFDDPKVGSLEVLAVCSISPDSVSCWDTDGKPDVEQTERLGAILWRQSAPVEFNHLKKNRYVVISVASKTESGLIPAPEPTLQSAPSVWSFSSKPMVSSYQPNHDWELYHVALDQDATTFDIPFVIAKYKTARALIPTVKGATVKIDGQILTYQSADAQPGDPFPGLPPGPRWKLTFAKPSDAQGVYYDFTVFGKDKKPIVHVDATGRAVDPKTFDAETKRSQGLSKKYPWAVASVTLNQNSTVEASTNVDPADIGFVQLISSRATPAQLTGIPADPRS